MKYLDFLHSKHRFSIFQKISENKLRVGKKMHYFSFVILNLIYLAISNTTTLTWENILSLCFILGSVLCFLEDCKTMPRKYTFYWKKIGEIYLILRPSFFFGKFECVEQFNQNTLFCALHFGAIFVAEVHEFMFPVHLLEVVDVPVNFSPQSRAET